MVHLLATIKQERVVLTGKGMERGRGRGRAMVMVMGLGLELPYSEVGK